MDSSNTLFLSAGEASGDLHGANLMRALKKKMPDLKFVGMGGPKMRKEGLECFIRAEDIAVVGLVEVVKRIPMYLSSIKMLAGKMKSHRVQMFIAIDFPDFNLRLSKAAINQDIFVTYYICPQVWAWRKGRIQQIEDWVDLLLTIFPFEARYFSRMRLKTQYVGHPLLDEVEPIDDIRTVEPGKGTIALMPGSRRSEILHHVPTLMKFIEQFLNKYPDLKFEIPCAPTLELDWLEKICFDNLSGSCHSALEVIGSDASSEILQRAHIAHIASGTSTLQACLCNVPFAIFYKLNPITHWLGKRLISLKHVGLVNLVAEKEVCREFIQSEMNPHNLIAESEALLWNESYRNSQLKSLQVIRSKLGGGGASDRAAESIMNSLRA